MTNTNNTQPLINPELLTHHPINLFRDVQSEYTTIDSDPHFWRVVRFFRLSDYAMWFTTTAAGPAAYYWWETKHPIGEMKLGMGTMGVVGFIDRFYGLWENAREIEMDRNEFLAARAQGNPHHLGQSELAPYLQGVAARHSRFAASKFAWLPWFNFVHHNQCVNWDLYKDLYTVKELN